LKLRRAERGGDECLLQLLSYSKRLVTVRITMRVGTDLRSMHLEYGGYAKIADDKERNINLNGESTE
jgi:hypothetical protein